MAAPLVKAPPPLGVYAEAGRLGLVIPLAEFRARLGGESALRKILGALTVTEKVHPGRPRGMARLTRKAYVRVRESGVERLIIPRIKGPVFLKARTRAGLPLLDGIRAAADAFPAPRRLAEGRCVLEEPLYEYQEAVVDYLCGPDGPLGESAVAEHRGVAYLQMDTGLGKSRIGLAVIVRRGEPALVVIPSSEAIGYQWIDEGREIYPELKIDLYRNPPKGSRKVPPGPHTHDVVVIIVNTFRDKSPSFMEGFGTVVLDEAHEYHSTHNCRALWLSQARAVLGLSATPKERPDGLDCYVHLHLGPIITPAEIPGFDARAVNFSGEVRVVEYAGHPAHCETATTPAGTMSAVLTIGNLIKDPARLRLAAAEIERLYRLHETASPEELLRLGLGPRPESAATPAHPAGEIRRHGVFVFAELRDALPALKEALASTLGRDEVFAPELDEQQPGGAKMPEGRWGCRGGAPMPISILRGGVKKTAVGQARAARSHVVLTTYGYSRRGISLPDMTAIVLFTPRRNGTRQVQGRILRRGSDESIVRQVVDIVDVRTGLKGQFADRRKVYTEKKYPISKVAVSWEDYAFGPCLGTGMAPEQRQGAAEGQDDEDFASMTTDDLLAAALGEDGTDSVNASQTRGPTPMWSLDKIEDIDTILNGA